MCLAQPTRSPRSPRLSATHLSRYDLILQASSPSPASQPHSPFLPSFLCVTRTLPSRRRNQPCALNAAFRSKSSSEPAPAFCGRTGFPSVQQCQYVSISMFAIQSLRVRRPASSERQMQIHCHPAVHQSPRESDHSTVPRSTKQKPRNHENHRQHSDMHVHQYSRTRTYQIPDARHADCQPWPHGQVPRQRCDNSLFRAKTFRGEEAPPVSVSPSVSMRDHDTPQRVLRPSVRPYTPSAPSALSTP